MSAEGTPARPAPGRLRVVVVTPEGSAFSGEAVSVVVPAHDGEVAFLPSHAPFVAAAGVGELRIETPDGRRRRWVLEGGVVEVLDDEVSVLAERVLAVESIDPAAEESGLREALALVPVGDEALDAREARAERSRARLAAARRPPTA